MRTGGCLVDVRRQETKFENCRKKGVQMKHGVIFRFTLNDTNIPSNKYNRYV